MEVTITCQSCEESFELDWEQLQAQDKGLKCPDCGKKLGVTETDELVSQLDGLFGTLAAMRKRFLFAFDVDSDNLPPPHDEGTTRKGVLDDDEDEDEDEDDDLADDDDLAPEDDDD